MGLILNTCSVSKKVMSVEPNTGILNFQKNP